MIHVADLVTDPSPSARRDLGQPLFDFLVPERLSRGAHFRTPVHLEPSARIPVGPHVEIFLRRNRLASPNDKFPTLVLVCSCALVLPFSCVPMIDANRRGHIYTRPTSQNSVFVSVLLCVFEEHGAYRPALPAGQSIQHTKTNPKSYGEEQEDGHGEV